MSSYDESSESQKFWNEEGGQQWVDNINSVETFIQPLSAQLLDVVSAAPGEKVLDVGCGGGLTSIRIAELVGNSGSVRGVDVSRPIIDIALARGKEIGNLDFELGDAATTDLGEGIYDVITSRFGVMFFDDPVAAFSNLHRALKDSGRMVFLCWRKLEENPWMARTAKAAFEIVPPPEDAPPPDPTAPGPFSLGDRVHLEGVLSAAGFEGLEIRAVDQGLHMGDLDDAVAFFLKMGPAADVARKATAEQLERIVDAIKQVLAEYETPQGVVSPAAAWIVSAGK